MLLPTDQSESFTPKVVDFGIAKLQSFEDAEALTRTGEVFGTPWYMSPEQCSGQKVDSRSDVYSLGCVLYEALTGAPPFGGTTALEAMMQHRTETAGTLSEASLGERFPPALEKVVAKMLAKDPARRYQNCLKVADDLAAIKRGEAPGEQSGTFTQKTQKKAEPVAYGLKHLVLVAVSCISLTGLIAWLIFSAQKRQTSGTSPVATATAPATDTSEKTMPGGTDFEIAEGSFCTIDNGTRLFHFPNKMNFGDLYWWTGPKEQRAHQHAAAGALSVSSGTNMIYEANGQIFELQPSYLSGFHNGDFSAFIVAPGTDASEMIDDRNFNKCIKLLGNFDSLRAVLLYTTPAIEPSALNTLGNLPHLKYLVLDRSEPDPHKIASFKNLNQLTLLSVNRLDGCTPIVKKLAQGSPVRYIAITESHLTIKDLELVSGIRTIEVANLSKNFAERKLSDSDRARIFSSLSKLPALQKIRIDREAVCSDGVEISNTVLASIKNMKRLTMFILDEAISAQARTKLISALPKGCQVFDITDRQDFEISAWFDCRVRNPDARNLW
ncbi:MAG TPA: serine/threonine-protein kinase, partial [Chroococcales cyanobacterium]